MERPEFDITIGKDGKVRVEVKGTSGKRCLELADLIKEIVGHEEKRSLTAEYYAPDGKVRIDTKVKLS
ncbi:MAG TPA: DUF2997 domain-containing protein [Phycisphaerae bacterium]|nr:DUF2997 domain-containing protein [Phycisphaerae bacterium]